MELCGRSHGSLSAATLELDAISKSFRGVRALDQASLSVASGTVHALLGENGAGKTTLMRIAFGMLRPDAGIVRVDGIERQFRSPADAIATGVGMIHQHFALVHAMTVAENIALGGSGFFDLKAAVAKAEQLSAETGLHVDPRARVGDLGIAGQQRVEILKALARDARILILDEPTAVLPPTDARSLLDWVRTFATGDRSAVLITHKVREALRISDHVTVLRRGRSVFSRDSQATTESDLATTMVEQTVVVQPTRDRPSQHAVVSTLDSVSVISGDHLSLNSTTLVVRGSEILGVAGVEGSGYRELLRVIAGRIQPASGSHTASRSIGFIPEDRHHEALALEMSSSENVAIRGLGQRQGMIDWATVRAATVALAQRSDVRGPLDAPVRQLSGGNQQKLVVARELGDCPELVVAENPTRGLDLLATGAVHEQLREARARGAAVVLYSSDLEELLSLSDRIIVVHAGRALEVPVELDPVTRALVGLPV